MDEIITAGGPRTLMQAHRELVRVRPGQDASSAAWLAYYQRSVTLYENIAEVDPGHELEARYWAHGERVRAERIATGIRAKVSGG